jgi:hypothetical protein
VTVATRLYIGVLSILEDDEEEKEHFEAVRRTTIASFTKKMWQPRLTASLRDQLLRDSVEPVIDEPPIVLS